VHHVASGLFAHETKVLLGFLEIIIMITVNPASMPAAMFSLLLNQLSANR
jgi:hypothetical protein